MKCRKYRFNYLAKQRDYNRRRRNSGCMKKYNLVYPYNPFGLEKPIIIIF